MKNRDVKFYYQEKGTASHRELFTGTTSKSGKIKFATKSEIGQVFLDVFDFESGTIYWNA
jgi:hypothetical protein